ncbi:hypothetical protein KIN20_009982 [Parelaphostrongylus tenuis]|uniref:Uncharacterized protein n=1 Tax=Parelaphostrongylus tenuis TaxID=148309 RepID=A0AAD5M8Y5_PARTN|nr:hypothetical protein KIN20_009982 [Parelaphostrongylus tenuis]
MTRTRNDDGGVGLGSEGGADLETVDVGRLVNVDAVLQEIVAAGVVKVASAGVAGPHRLAAIVDAVGHGTESGLANVGAVALAIVSVTVGNAALKVDGIVALAGKTS